MQRDPTISALAACGMSCMKAANGHHRRWAVKRCTDALVPAYPVGHVSSNSLGPRAWARPAQAGRAAFLLRRVGHGLTVRPRRPFNNRRNAAWSPMRLMGITTVS